MNHFSLFKKFNISRFRFFSSFMKRYRPIALFAVIVFVYGSYSCVEHCHKDMSLSHVVTHMSMMSGSNWLPRKKEKWFLNLELKKKYIVFEMHSVKSVKCVLPTSSWRLSGKSHTVLLHRFTSAPVRSKIDLPKICWFLF